MKNQGCLGRMRCSDPICAEPCCGPHHSSLGVQNACGLGDCAASRSHAHIYMYIPGDLPLTFSSQARPSSHSLLSAGQDYSLSISSRLCSILFFLLPKPTAFPVVTCTSPPPSLSSPPSPSHQHSPPIKATNPSSPVRTQPDAPKPRSTSKQQKRPINATKPQSLIVPPSQSRLRTEDVFPFFLSVATSGII